MYALRITHLFKLLKFNYFNNPKSVFICQLFLTIKQIGFVDVWQKT